MLRDIQYILNGHSSEVTNLSWSPDGTQLASASLDYSVRLWNLANQQNTTTYMGHTQAVLTVAWSHHSYQLASGGQDNTVRVWDTAGNAIYNLHQPGPVEKVIWTPNDQHIIVDIYGHKVQEIVLSSNKTIPIGRVFANYSLALSPNGRYLAVGAQLGNIIVYDTTNFSRPPIEKVIHTSRVSSLAWSPNSTLLASGGADRNVRVMDITTRTIVHTLPIDGLANDISWEPSNTGRLAIASSNGTVIVWNINTDQHTFHAGHQASVTAVAWGQRALASGSTDKRIIIWAV